MVIASPPASSHHATYFDMAAADGEFCLRRLYLSLTGQCGAPIIVTADSSAENLAWLRAAYPAALISEVARARLIPQIEKRYGAKIVDEATFELARAAPALSARTVMTCSQALWLGAIVLVLVVAFAMWPLQARDALVGVLALGFVGGMLFRVILAWMGGADMATRPNNVADGSSLPVYTILVPMYDEANVLPRLIRSVLLLDYPHDRLDVKLIVEADDFATATMADAMAMRGPFEVIRVPPGKPRTKPRACNYAFKFARGEFTVIYDAEDRPERDQLRKAVAMFRTEPRDIVCLQARLNFYNANENWLTRLFALDYALWFDVLLPGLERLGLPMPLGGTSNHFRTSVLKASGAWDPFNVTEDADLGVRLAQLGKRVMMLDSTTFEEAPTDLGAWLKQRSRWLKGYMQTWLVHMRDPYALRRGSGWRGLLALQFFLGGSVIVALANPILWLVFLLTNVLRVQRHGEGADDLALTIAVTGLVTGNAVMIWLALIAPRRRGWKGFAPYGLTVTFYWALISVAAYRGLWQLATRPFHWDKTAHGVSRFGRVRP